MIKFKGRHFPKDIILMAVQWKLALPLRVLSKILQEIKAVLFLGVVKLQVHKTASKQGSVPYSPSVLF